MIGPAFKEMRDFENRIFNNDFDYLLSDDNTITDDMLIDSYDRTINDFEFLIYTYKVNSKYKSYMALNYDNNTIDFLCGKIDLSKDQAKNTFNHLKELVSNNDLIIILDYVKDDMTIKMNELNKQLQELTNKS